MELLDKSFYYKWKLLWYDSIKDRDMPFNRDRVKGVLLEQLKKLGSIDLGVLRDDLNFIKTQLDSPFIVAITGLRRVGKSTFLAQIAKQFYKQDDYYYINFDDDVFWDFKVPDFRDLEEILLELFGERRIFLFDEIQNIYGWETFVRRLLDQGKKIYVTGSNSSLFSKEFGTRLTGRNLPIEMFPFSFKEFLRFWDLSYEKQSGVYDTVTRASLKKHFQNYMKLGGIAQALRYPELEIHKNIYENSIYKDVIARYNIDSDKAVRDLTYFLFSNISAPISFNKLKAHIHVKNVTTVKNYIDYLEQAWLLFTVNSYAASIKKQQIAPKKIYATDTGMVNQVAFAVSDNYGPTLENIVFLALRKRGEDIFYYKSEKGYEVDFYLRRTGELYQACWDISDHKTREREVRALIAAQSELKAKELYIISFDIKEEIVIGKNLIKVIPVWEWLLEKC